MRALSIGVVGCGTAGSAAALFLARAGHRVTLYERVPVPGPLGAGIVLQPSGMQALAALDLLQPIVDKGARIDALVARTSSGRPVVNLRYATLAPHLFGLGLHRGVLFDTLFQAVCRESHLEVRCGVDVARLDRGRLLDAGGGEVGRHELVVVADGARSKLREHFTGLRSVQRYPWGALWFVGADEEVPRFSGTLNQWVKGTHRLLGLLPTGLGPGDEADTPLVSLFWSIRADRVDAWRAAGLKPWKEEVLSSAPQADALLAQIRSPGQLLFAEYHDVVMSPWHDQHTVFLGDAAHAMSPQLGQGCNLALIDAMVLSECVAAHDDVPEALAAYSRRRRVHLGWYQFITRALTPWFQSDYSLLGRLRDALMGPACRVPWVGRQMLLGMAGVAMGPHRRALPLPPRP